MPAPTTEDRRDYTHLVQAIVEALNARQCDAQNCLTEEEKRWVKLAIKDQADRAALRQAVIEKSLAGLVWSGLVGIGILFMDYIKSHGFK